MGSKTNNLSHNDFAHLLKGEVQSRTSIWMDLKLLRCMHALLWDTSKCPCYHMHSCHPHIGSRLSQNLIPNLALMHSLFPMGKANKWKDQPPAWTNIQVANTQCTTLDSKPTLFHAHAILVLVPCHGISSFHSTFPHA